MKKKRLVLTVGFIMILFLSMFYLNSIAAPNAIIRKKLLKKLPVGTGMDEVIQYIKNKDAWELYWVDTEEGYISPLTGQHPKIGSQHIRAYIGSFAWDFFDVYIDWGFDENSKLVDINVEKDANSI